MPLEASALFDFLREVERKLERPIELVAAGGTALTLLGVKPSTLDIDFTGPKASIAAFQVAHKRLPHGFRIDCWPDGQVFSQFLPADYLKRSKRIKRIGKIELRALSPLDIIVTKAGRLDRRDMQDIRDCLKRFKVSRAQVRERAKQVEYVGREAGYRERVDFVVDKIMAK